MRVLTRNRNLLFCFIIFLFHVFNSSFIIIIIIIVVVVVIIILFFEEPLFNINYLYPKFCDITKNFASSSGLYTFGPKRDEVMREWRRLHNKELYALYSSPNIVRGDQIKQEKFYTFLKAELRKTELSVVFSVRCCIFISSWIFKGGLDFSEVRTNGRAVCGRSLAGVWGFEFRRSYGCLL
jgi:hypothetical protein